MNISSFCPETDFLSSPYMLTLIIKSAKSLLGIYHIFATSLQPKTKLGRVLDPQLLPN